MTAHMLWLCGITVIRGPQMTFRIVRSAERWSVWTSARTGSPNAFRTALGSSIARATTSRTAGSADPSVTGAQQSALNRSRSNMSMTAFSLRITFEFTRVRRPQAVARRVERRVSPHCCPHLRATSFELVICGKGWHLLHGLYKGGFRALIELTQTRELISRPYVVYGDVSNDWVLNADVIEAHRHGVSTFPLGYACDALE